MEGIHHSRAPALPRRTGRGPLSTGDREDVRRGTSRHGWAARRTDRIPLGMGRGRVPSRPWGCSAPGTVLGARGHPGPVGGGCRDTESRRAASATDPVSRSGGWRATSRVSAGVLLLTPLSWAHRPPCASPVWSSLCVCLCPVSPACEDTSPTVLGPMLATLSDLIIWPHLTYSRFLGCWELGFPCRDLGAPSSSQLCSM